VIPSRSAIEHCAVEGFQARFGTPPTFVASAPGRVNLIGEHTDYNDGFVFPAAIDRGTAVAIGPRDDDRLVMRSGSGGPEGSFPVSRLYPSEDRAWTDYLIGVASLLRDRGKELRGANLCVHGNVPRGAGLSSSAALELATAFALIRLNGLDVPPIDVIRLCQRAEHEFAGVKCGVMDQFIACLGKRGHALLLDCRSLDYDQVPIPPGVQVLICDTGVRRSLAVSEYNARRAECDAGVRLLSARIPGIRALRDLSMDQLREFGDLLDPVIRRRCAHVVEENQRVVLASRALRAGDLSEFGKLMYDSHLSLKTQYEVSCAELDLVVDICAEAEGVFGARMTGAGFGGCAICLVRDGAVESVVARLSEEYPRGSGKNPSVYVCSVDDGVTTRAL
jgi:galactokinase